MKQIVYVLLLFSHFFVYSQQTQIRISVSNGGDDIEKTTDFYPASSDLELGGFDSFNGGVQFVAIRFQNVALPANAQISKAYIQFTTKSPQPQTAAVVIKCQEGNASAYLPTENILLRNYVSPTITWNPPAWTVLGENGVNQQTANLSALVQAAIATGWTSGNALSFVLQGNAAQDNILNARSYETLTTHAGAPELVIEYSTNANTTLTIPIATGNDDVEVGATNFYAGSSDLDLGGFDTNVGGTEYTALRFQNVALPTNAQITKAYIQFTTNATSSQTATITIKCQQGNALTYNRTENLLLRTYVAPSVTWNPPAWTVAGANSVSQQTASLTAQVQAAIAAGWASGNALSFILQGNATKDNIINARTYETLPTHAGAAQLVIEYTTGTNPCSPDIAVPVITNCPSNISLTTTTTTAIATWTMPTVTDNCTTNITPSVLSAPTAGLVSGSAFPIGTTTITHNAKDVANNNAIPCIFTVTVTGGTGSTTLRVPITDGNDDIEVSNVAYATSSDLEIGGFDSSNNGAQYVALRFQNVALPPNVQIVKAYIQFTTKSVQAATTNVTIKCQQGNANAYNLTENLLLRTYIPPTVTWNPPAWTVLAESGVNQQTANLAAQVQATTATGWQSGNALSFILQGNATQDNILNGRSYEHNATHAGAPELVIEYSTTITPATALFINEVAPQGTIAITSDWIELYNDATTAVSLDSVYITNKLGTPFKASLAGLTMSAKGFLLLYADNLPALGSTHLNFKVSASGEKLYLNRKVNGAAVQMAFFETPVSSFEEDNVTFGGLTEGVAPPLPTALTKFLGGTPNAANAGGIRYIKATNSLPRGILLAPATATLTAPSGTTIRYTTDNSTPSRISGTIYTQPINITTTTVLKVFGYSANSETKVESFTYIFPVKGPELLYPNLVTAADYEAGMKLLPIVSLSTTLENLVSPTEKMVTFEYINKFGEAGSVSLSCGVKAYGNSSLDDLKTNLRIHFKNDYGYGNLEYPIFKKDDVDTLNNFTPTTKFDVLDLKIGQDGPSSNGYGMMMTSQSLVSKTMREMGNIDLHTRYVHAFVNGVYHGIYTLKEHFDEHFGETYYGGNKDFYDYIENPWPTGQVNLNSNFEPQGTIVNWNTLRTAAQNNNFQTVKSYLNVKQYIDMMLTIMYFDNEWEFRALADQTLVATKFVVENHDTDGAMTKTIGDITPFNYDQKWQISDPNYSEVFRGPGGIFGSLYDGNNKEFKTLVRDRVYEAFQKPNGALTAGRITAKMNALKDVIRPAWNMEWARFNGTFYNNFDQEFAANLPNIPARFQYNLDKWLEKGLKHTLLPVAFNQPSGTVTTPVLATNPNVNGVIYYTINGTDPMGNDGIISPDAKLYTTQLALNVGVNNVVARVYFNTEFGPKTTATYTSTTTVVAAQIAEILSVSGRLDGQKAVVSWLTRTTQVLDYFKIEKLKNTGTYQTLQTLNAQYSGNQNGIEQYNFTDENMKEGDNIYRIALFSDVLKTPQYSDLINIKFMPTDGYSIYPNPASDFLEVDLRPVEGQMVSISIANSIGTVVFDEKIEKASLKKRINIEGLDAGYYSIFIKAEGKRAVVKRLSIIR